MKPSHSQPGRTARAITLLTLLSLTACSLALPPAGSGPQLAAKTTPTGLPGHGPAATAPPPRATQTVTPFQPAANTATPTTPAPSPTQVPPPPFDPPLLRKGVAPRAYLAECDYLRARWDPANSDPGTVVVPVMFHSIAQPGRAITADTTITQAYFDQFMQHAEALGFQTITTAQLVGFLERNEKIPQRALLLILDDRRPGVIGQFMPYLQRLDWTLTLGWITAKNGPSDWKRIEDLAASGHLDVQSHGYNHVYIVDQTPVDVIEQELTESMALIEEHFGNRPLAYVWPGGNFTPLAVQMARQAGYQVGFTVYSRGPVMFNWIPLGEPEAAMGDPRMVLPRFWSTAAYANLDDAVRFSEAAAAYAEQQRDAEVTWMNASCPPAPPAAATATASVTPTAATPLPPTLTHPPAARPSPSPTATAAPSQ